MCIVLFAWQTHPRYPLLVAANRDEFHRRPAEPARWRDDMFCGRDLAAGGTWLGVTRTGRFATVTNFREPIEDHSRGTRSRGDLPTGYLAGDLSPRAYCEHIATHQDDYGPFNLLVGDARELWYMSNRGAAPQRVPPGVHGLSNGLLDTPWPKVTRGMEKLAAIGEGQAHPQHLLSLLHDSWRPDDHWLPDTGVGMDLERLVAPIFIPSEVYGTRASSAVRLGSEGVPEMVEQRWRPDGSPDGKPSSNLDERDM